MLNLVDYLQILQCGGGDLFAAIEVNLLQIGTVVGDTEDGLVRYVVDPGQDKEGQALAAPTQCTQTFICHL